MTDIKKTKESIKYFNDRGKRAHQKVRWSFIIILVFVVGFVGATFYEISLLENNIRKLEAEKAILKDEKEKLEAKIETLIQEKSRN